MGIYTGNMAKSRQLNSIEVKEEKRDKSGFMIAKSVNTLVSIGF